ncbi:hypothetical protein OsJ_07570 [Oryza sativa Japonica Group]|uniref:Long-chain-alcohol oxidase n=1 Tax=Oryza sativa subsp. japonica TaxID=39947 RepID=B9F154_ORYSJ|nr:hypothetical protein OsJ_07570 [Oryza sativa Japonica Group]
MGEEKSQQRRRQGHPLLRGGGAGKQAGRRYTHGFSASQMVALAALCGALAPSLPPDTRDDDDDDAGGGRYGGAGPSDAKAVRDFLLASAADPPVPDEVAELNPRMCLREALALVRAVLWLLGTRLGTLALCGGRCVSWGRWPFVLTFAEMPVERREEALGRWSRVTVLPPLRAFFLVVKVFCLYVFYSWIDESSENPHWRAIGYSPPTDEPPAEEHTEATKRPLDDGVVETINLTDASLPSSLAEKGLAVTDDAARNVCRVECDVAIVGSGCGGGVAAAVLAGAGHKVVVIEKGNYFTSRDYTSFEGPSINQLYESGGFVTTMNGGGLLLAGSTVGGGSAVNWSACLKTPEFVRREWAAAHGLPLFATPDYAAAMDKVFERLGVTSGCTEEGLQNKVLRKGCEKLGYKVDAVARNSSEGHYCGSCGFGCRTGDKRGTDTTWLVDAVGRGAVILTGCKAEKLVLERGGARGRRCVGVVARSTNPAITKTLERSGLTNPHIGKNLHLHPTALAWGYFPDTMPDLKGKALQGRNHNVDEPRCPGCPGETRRSGCSGSPGRCTSSPWSGDRGSGTVHGERRVAYRLDAADREDIRDGLRRALRVLVAAGAAEVGTHRSDGQRLRCEGLTEEALEEFLDGVTVVRGPQSRSETWGLFCSAHHMGSCRMGATAGDGAVDARGESWEAERLYVCDGSVLPTAGCEKLGYKVDAVARNSSEGHYCGSCGFGCRTGDKRGTDTTWLVDAVGRGAVILTGCKAEKLVLERGGAKGQAVRRRGGQEHQPGDHEDAGGARQGDPFRAAGSLLTPVLLQRSGLTNPHIGKNLHLHPTALAWGYFPDTMPDLKGKAYEGGIITSMHKVETSGAGAPHRAILETPMMAVAATGTQMPWLSGRDSKERMLRFARTVHIFSLVRDRGSGTVHGERRVAYRLDAADREDIRDGLRRALRVLVAAGAAEVGTHRSDGQRLRCEGLTEEALEEFLDGVTVVRGPQSRSETWGLFCSAHHMGSCRMGATAGDGAVDARGESWEAERLYVCDGSVLPTAVGVNPMITIQSVAYCLANGIADSLSAKTT